MPRSGPGVYTLPATYEAVDGELATAAQHNDPLEDLQTDANTPRPIVAGGTGQDTAVEALDALTVKSSNIASAATTNLSTASGRFVHITGTTTITAFTTQTAGIERELVFDGALTLTHNATTLILPSAADITTAAGDVAVMVSEGSGNWRCINYQSALSRAPYITPWVTYTPTFTGFGTASSITVWSRRIGDTLHIRGRFTSGTSTAVEARVTLGFNGVNGVLAIDGTKISGAVNQVGGTVTRSTAAAASAYCLLQGGLGYITFGTQSAGTASQTSVVGSSLLPTIGDIASFMCEVPISGW